MTVEFDADLWLWDARTDSWTFVSMPPHLADDVLDAVGPAARGFGSVRVEVTIGATTWRTSLFPDSRSRTYVLPVKKAVRSAEGLAAGDAAHVTLRLLDA
jgi:Domain of unknown function (DUF1905)